MTHNSIIHEKKMYLIMIDKISFVLLWFLKSKLPDTPGIFLFFNLISFCFLLFSRILNLPKDYLSTLFVLLGKLGIQIENQRYLKGNHYTYIKIFFEKICHLWKIFHHENCYAFVYPV